MTTSLPKRKGYSLVHSATIQNENHVYRQGPEGTITYQGNWFLTSIQFQFRFARLLGLASIQYLQQSERFLCGLTSILECSKHHVEKSKRKAPPRGVCRTFVVWNCDLPALPISQILLFGQIGYGVPTVLLVPESWIKIPRSVVSKCYIAYFPRFGRL